jgi:hypothetical protein
MLPYNEKLFCVSRQDDGRLGQLGRASSSVDEIVNGAFGVVKRMGYNSVFRYRNRVVSAYLPTLWRTRLIDYA